MPHRWSARLAAPAAHGAGRSAGLRRRSGVRLAAFHSGRDQVLGVADGGEARAGAPALLSAGPLPRRHIGQHFACLGVVPGAGVGVVDDDLRRRRLLGRCAGAGFLRGRCAAWRAGARMVWRNVGRRIVRRSLWAVPGCGHVDLRASGAIICAPPARRPPGSHRCHRSRRRRWKLRAARGPGPCRRGAPGEAPYRSSSRRFRDARGSSSTTGFRGRLRHP